MGRAIYEGRARISPIGVRSPAHRQLALVALVHSEVRDHLEQLLVLRSEKGTEAGCATPVTRSNHELRVMRGPVGARRA